MTRTVSKLAYALPICAATLVAKPAVAEIPEMLTPTPNTMYAGGMTGIGGNVTPRGFPSQFKLQPEFGWHMLNDDFTGLSIGAVMAFDMGGGFFLWQFAPQIGWDFQIIEDLGLYIGPRMHFGLAAGTAGVGGSAAFNWGFGVQGRLSLAESFYVVLQPFALDFFHGFGLTIVRYDWMLGGGMTF